MRRSEIKCITHHHPTFLKATYAQDHIVLVPHDGWISPGETYIRWEHGVWKTYRMTIERVPIRLTRHRTLWEAMANV